MAHPGEGFKAKALRQQPRCAVCGKAGPLEIHHVIPKSKLRTELGREVTTLARWDLRNAMTLCNRHHTHHHNRMEPIALELLSHENWQFAMEHGLEWYLERTYPTEDASLL